MQLVTHACPVCGGDMPSRVSDWTFYCTRCEYWAADLKCDAEAMSNDIHYGEAVSFLDELRISNFNTLLDKAEQVVAKKDLSILDVGCATGLFIQVAKERGHRVQGVEPNPHMAAQARQKGLSVAEGYFPDALPAAAEFDVIVFNDVFEHIPDLEPILAGVKAKLKHDGLLIISLPSSDGLLFRMGQTTYRVGITKLWERLWQTMFSTPHLHYFNARSLDRLASKSGFAPRTLAMELPILSVSGLWGRVSADKSASFVKKAVIYAAALGVYPILRFFPQDAFVAFYGLNARSASKE